MRVRVLLFGILKEYLDTDTTSIELPDGATVADLLEKLAASESIRHLENFAVSVNAEFAKASQVLRDGDEVGMLPPVSGGTPSSVDIQGKTANRHDNVVAFTRSPIPSGEIIAAAKRPEDGAVVVFDGIVRNETRGREVLHLDYESYEEMALHQMQRLAEEAKERFAVRYAAIVHRLGRMKVGDTSVLIVVASAHRAQAFDACRWLIDTIKTTVPIWKRETFVDGASWADGEPFPAQVAISPQSLEK